MLLFDGSLLFYREGSLKALGKYFLSLCLVILFLNQNSCKTFLASKCSPAAFYCRCQMLEQETSAGCVRSRTTSPVSLRYSRVCWTVWCSCWRFRSEAQRRPATDSSLLMVRELYFFFSYEELALFTNKKLLMMNEFLVITIFCLILFVDFCFSSICYVLCCLRHYPLVMGVFSISMSTLRLVITSDIIHKFLRRWLLMMKLDFILLHIQRFLYAVEKGCSLYI